ncbi:MAG: HAD family hydrolase, partial [Blastocatellia bacterium]|nr:HAD family hydrolase [Blastocatellia bacterium]
MAIKAISFDFWNTLFTERPGGFRLYKQRRLRLLREAVCAQGNFTDAQLERACSIEAESHHHLWIEEHRTLTAAERLGKILEHLEIRLRDEVRADIVNAFEEGILEYPPVLVEGARETVERLASRYRLAIISDVGFSPGRVLKELLGRAGLLGLFDSLVFSDEAGRSKPHREVFERTARSLGAHPAEIVHIGDLEHTDIRGAKMAGYRAIRFSGVTPMNE